jgi:hypothetical protein
MVMSEFGGPKPGDDNPPGAPHNPDINSQVRQTLFEHVSDGPPNPMQGYLAEQQNLATEADRLRGLLQKSPAEFVQAVLPFLDLEINLGKIAGSSQNQQLSQDMMMNFSMQSGIGAGAASIKKTLETQGAGALNDPGIRQNVEMLLKQADWVVGRR